VTTTRVIHRASEMAKVVAEWKASGDTIALVPTMGALHDGHLALVTRAQTECSRVVVSVFVNPLQFGTGEDFDRYPRTFSSDLQALRGSGVDAVFAPEVTDVYPDWPDTKPTVFAGPVGDIFEGADRPGHFDGVLTVVSRLFDLVSCDVAVFGQKDAQQVFLVSQMARLRTPPVRISVVDTVREASGLARSSRNTYLSDVDRDSASALHRAVRDVSRGLGGVEYPTKTNQVETLLADASKAIAGNGRTLHYLDVVDRDTFTPYRGGQTRGVVIIGACSVGGVRLIDAMRVDRDGDTWAGVA
jgi:pantoate--beta-alanine ligase